MLAHPTLDRLNTMGLTGMARAFGELAVNAEAEQLSHAEWLGLLLEREWSWRHDRKLAARLRFAKLRHQAVPEDVDYRSERGLDRALSGTTARFFTNAPRVSSPTWHWRAATAAMGACSEPSPASNS